MKTNKPMKIVVLSAAVLSGLTLGYSAIASDDDRHGYREDHEYVHDMSSQGEILKLENILKNSGIPDDHRVLEVELEEEYGQTIYEIEVIDPDGRVHKYKFDAKTGEQLKHRQD